MLYQLSYAGVALAYNAALLPLHLARHVISIAPFILASGFGLAHVRAAGGQYEGEAIRRDAQRSRPFVGSKAEAVRGLRTGPGVFLRNDPPAQSPTGNLPTAPPGKCMEIANPWQARKPLIISNTGQIFPATSRAAVYLVDASVYFVDTGRAMK